MRTFFKAGVLLLALSTWSDARAAGGAHIVDDSEVETPGHCHVELWVTRFVPGNGYANAAPACTPKQIPFLEVGLAHQDHWSEENNAPILGPTVKVNLRPQDTGLGLGITASSGVNLASASDRHRVVCGTRCRERALSPRGEVGDEVRVAVADVQALLRARMPHRLLSVQADDSRMAAT